MGLDTFPLLQDLTCLIMYKNTVFKLKLEYQHVSQQMKEAFIQHVSERAAHCQIEDVCRALLYNIERQEQVTAIQSENFVFYPEVHEWPLANKVQFFINGKQLSCHQDIILLKLICKSDLMSSPGLNEKGASNSKDCSNHSYDISCANAIKRKSDNKNASTLCPENTDLNNKKSSSEIVSSTKNHAAGCDTPATRISNTIGSLSPENNHTVSALLQQHRRKTNDYASRTEQDSLQQEISHIGTTLTTETVIDCVLSGSGEQEKAVEFTLKGRNHENVSREKHQVDHLGKDDFKQSSSNGKLHLHKQHENSVSSSKVMSKRTSQSKLQNRKYVLNQVLLESRRKISRKSTSSLRGVISDIPFKNTGKSRITSGRNTLLTSGKRKLCKRKQSTHRQGPVQYTDTSDETNSSNSLEVVDKHVIEISNDGKILYQSERITSPEKITSVSSSMTLRRKQRVLPKDSDGIEHFQKSKHKSSLVSTRNSRLSRQMSCRKVVYEGRQKNRHTDVCAETPHSDTSGISISNQRIATKYKLRNERNSSQISHQDSLKKKVAKLGVKGTVRVAGENFVQTRASSQSSREISDSSIPVSKEALKASRSLRSSRKVVPLSPESSHTRGNHISKTLAAAQRHMLESKDGVWLFWNH